MSNFYTHTAFPGVVVLILAALSEFGPKILRSQRPGETDSPDAWLFVVHPEHEARDLAALDSQFPCLRAQLEGNPLDHSRKLVSQEGEQTEIVGSWKRCPAKEKQ